MRVIVNQLAALGRRTGIGHYTAQLIRCMRQQTHVREIDVFPDGLGGQIWGLAARVRSRNVLGRLRLYGARLRARHFRSVCARHTYDLYHEPNFIPLPNDCPTIATLHDLSFLLHPEWHPADRVAYFERHFERSLDRCVHFLAISEFGRQELIRVLHIPPDRITRTYMGIRPGLSPMPVAQVDRSLRELRLPPSYLLYLGTIEPRKNLLVLLQAYCALPRPLRDRCPLLLVGHWGWNTGQVADYFQREARHRGVLHIGYVPERYLSVIYNGARALVYPSLYEGFGMPPLETMACGRAVIASTAGALVETVGMRAHLVAPDDIGGWSDAMARVIRDQDWWRSLCHGVTAVARPYTWDRCAADTLRVYRTLCGTATETLCAA